MGRTRNRSKKQPTVSSPAPATPEPSIDALLDKARSLVDRCDYDLALRFAERILQRSPAHVQARELLGVVHIETGDIEAAKKTFLSLLPPSPNAPPTPPPSAHLYLAQLSEDDPTGALQHYRAAIDIFSAQLKGKERAVKQASNDEVDAELRASIVRALIGMVEIWMDPSYDLCFDPNAEKTCEDLLNLALTTDPGNAEALQALASVRLSQQRPEDAKNCLEKSWASWKDLDPDDARSPPIPTRLSLVKMFLELSLFTPALLVLHGVMSTDDQEVEAWYLEGWCFFLMSEQAKESGGTLDDLGWEELAKDARDCLETCQVLHVNQQHPDIPLLDHVKELITKLDALGITTSISTDSIDELEDIDDSDENDDAMLL